jgi:hypothetical protein
MDLTEVLKETLREVIREELAAFLTSRMRHDPAPDDLIGLEDACALLKVDRGWLYKHAKDLPFTRKLSHKKLRFSKRGIMLYIESGGEDG